MGFGVFVGLAMVFITRFLPETRDLPLEKVLSIFEWASVAKESLG